MLITSWPLPDVSLRFVSESWTWFFHNMICGNNRGVTLARSLRRTGPSVKERTRTDRKWQFLNERPADAVKTQNPHGKARKSSMWDFRGLSFHLQTTLADAAVVSCHIYIFTVLVFSRYKIKYSNILPALFLLLESYDNPAAFFYFWHSGMYCSSLTSPVGGDINTMQ